MTKFPFIIIVLLVLISCGDKDLTFPIGSDYVDVNTNIRYFDTLTVQSYTVMIGFHYNFGTGNAGPTGRKIYRP